MYGISCDPGGGCYVLHVVFAFAGTSVQAFPRGWKHV